MNIINNISSYITSIKVDTDNSFLKLTNSNIYKINIELQKLGYLINNEDKFDINLSKIVVVGSQSSAKSTCLNNIIGFDILPTGKTIVTRTPICINLLNIEDKSKITVELYNKIYDLQPNCDNKIILNNISKHIQEKTNEIAGDNKNISLTPIFIKIYSSNVPNLSLVDLPGMTSVALQDQGQSKDIVMQIRNMIKHYITDKKTIVLNIIPAKTDIETDMALGFLKENDIDNDRIIGCLSKVDLMNSTEHVGNYIEGNISNDLKFKNGYYLIRNFDGEQKYDKEIEYFSNHFYYKTLLHTKRLGIKNLSNNLSDLLLKNITSQLPNIIKEIYKLDNDINKKISEYGDDIDDDITIDDNQKILKIQRLTNDFSKTYSEGLHNRGSLFNIGTNINNIFLRFKKEIDCINPFNSDYYSDEKINQLIENYNGNHMSFSHLQFSIDILENVMKDTKNRPFMYFKQIINDYLNIILDELLKYVNEILCHKKFSKYDKLKVYILNIITDILNTNKIETNLKIDKLLRIEEEFIWCDDQDFKQKTQNLEQGKIKDIFIYYFDAIKVILKHSIHKNIMYYFIYQSEKDISNILFKQCIVNNDNLTNLLYQDNTILNEKKRLFNIKNAINKIKKII